MNYAFLMGVTPLFTRMKVAQVQICWGEMMSWAGDRLSGWFAFLPAAVRKTQTKSPSNISSDSGAQLWPLSLNTPHSSALKGPVSSSYGQLTLDTRAVLRSMKLKNVHSIRRVHEVGFNLKFQDFRNGYKMKSDKSKCFVLRGNVQP